MKTEIEAEEPFSEDELARISAQVKNAAKLRFAKAVADLDELGVDVQQIDLNEVLSFARAFLR